MTENKRFFLNLIGKSLKNGGTRVVVIAISIMLGACVCASFINVYLDIDAKVSRELKSYGANMVFVPSDDNDFMSEDEFNNIISNVGSNSVIGSSGYLFANASIGTSDAIVMGVNFSSLKKVKPFLDLRDGSMINVDFDDKNVLIGIDLAKQAGFKAGDEIDLRAPGSQEIIKVRIKGVVASGAKEDALLITSLSLAQRLSGKKSKLNYAEAVVIGSFDEVSNLASKLTTSNIVAKVVAKVSKQEGFVLAKIKLLMALVSLVILLITSMCVNTSLSAILLARNKEIALLRALGAGRKNILNLFGSETFVLAFCAAFLGSFMGYLLAQVLGLAIFDAYIDFRIASIPVSMGLSLVFAALAAVYPIRRALNLKMADILRGE